MTVFPHDDLGAPPSEGPAAPPREARGEAPRPANRLIAERSPYLQQHARNPVDWFPWGAEAHEKARREQKPIFLSIGYSTCHWCHVMGRESFEDEATARLLNEHFVSIKVDREERPDLDHLYMAAVQALTGQGGWPMTVFLTPDLEPFFGGTYFPPEDRWGRPGFRTVLEDIATVWSSKRSSVVGAAAQVAAYLRGQGESDAGGDPTPARLRSAIAAAVDALKERYDPHRGGFGGEPKFPTPHVISFMLRHAHRTGDREALAMVAHTLDAMAAGGIHDHLGGGFHRYATDAGWLVPHFEKMLYDQAGLALAYTEAWLITREPRYAEVVRGILDYVLRDLTHPDGGFYSAEDADSEGEEGRFYVWTHEEILSILGPDLGALFCREFGVAPGGNWEGRSILHRPRWEPWSIEAPGALPSRGTGPGGLPAAGIEPPGADLERARALLLEARGRRPRPHRDEKVIAAWNGSMMAALTLAGRALAEPHYVEAAGRAGEFAARNFWRDGRLLRHFHDGQASALGCLDDYAHLGLGYLGLHQATGRAEHLFTAATIAGELRRLFERPEGGLAYTGSDAEELIAPVQDVHDGAMPASASAATMFLLLAGHAVQREELIASAHAQLRAMHGKLGQAPGAHAALLSAADLALGPVTEIALAGAPGNPALEALRRVVDDVYLPNAVVTWRGSEGGGPSGDAGNATQAVVAQVCVGSACRPPVRSPRELAKLLKVAQG